MDIIFALIIGLIIGGITAWFIASARTASVYAQKNRDTETRLTASETNLGSARIQIQEKNEQLAGAASRLTEEQRMRVKAETQLAEAQKSFAEQREMLADATQKLREAFSSLSSEALKSNNEAFLHLAQSTLEKYAVEAKGDLGKRQEAIDQMIKPLRESLQQYEQNLKQVEITRESAYTGLRHHLDDLKLTQERLQNETNTLVGALKTSQVRGRYGEIGLRRVVEFSGMSRYCDFEEQVSVNTEEGKLRPDLVVRLPGGKSVIIDSKVPLTAYMQAFETTNDDERRARLALHAKAVREHMKLLSAKSYWSQFKESPDYVVLYMQIESSFGAALEYDLSLIEDSMNNHIILATPTTLISLLRTVAYSWHQQEVEENSKKIWETGVELFNRISVLLEHLGSVGSNLKTAVDSYNKAVGSLESRFIPQAKKLKELGAAQRDKDLPELPHIEATPRSLPEASSGNDEATF
jgi:DNA recombination protein RmuC